VDDPHVVPSVDPWALVGQTIAQRYRVDALIGVGGMGSVLRCHHLGLGRDIAVKVLHPERSAQPESSARFTREARSASRLDHPNCVRVLDFGEWQPRPDLPAAKYLAMELVDGEELGRLLREPLPLRTAVEYAGQILDGLGHAHARGIVHRDLKPENIIVTRPGSKDELLKLVDFGIAKIVGGEGLDARMTHTGRVFGTPHYMSPEQVTGSDTDGRSDLYAVGVLLWQMITGKLPFESEDPTVLMGKHLYGELPELPAGVPPTLVAIVGRLLAKEPEDRYQSAAEARVDLDAVLREIETTAAWTPRKRRSIARAWPLALAVGATLVVTIALPPTGGEDVAQAGFVAPSAVAPQRIEPTSGADPVAVHRLRGMSDLDAALARADALLRDAPDDARLYLERGRILARAGRGARALADYERAIIREPEVVNGRVIAEIAAIARDPALRTLALDVALQNLDERAHPLLTELLADEEHSLEYRDRHRAFAAIAGSPAAASIDERRMIALDLEQANGAQSPCLAFAAALAEIERDPARELEAPLRNAVPPRARASDDANTVALCDALPARLAEVRGIVGVSAAEPATTRAPRRPSEPVAKADQPKTRASTPPKRRSAVNRLRGLAG
jgi:hypothetical protein